jgi:hypothetical protein
VIVDAREHVLEVRVGLDGVEPGRLDEAEGHGRDMPAVLRTREEPVLAIMLS